MVSLLFDIRLDSLISDLQDRIDIVLEYQRVNVVQIDFVGLLGEIRSPDRNIIGIGYFQAPSVLEIRITRIAILNLEIHRLINIIN